MRLFISKSAALGLCACALLVAACSPQDGSAPAVSSSSSTRTANGNTTAPATKQAPAQPAAQQTAPPEGDTRRITVEETQAAIAKGDALVVDVREESAYKASHIKGAKSVPLSRFNERIGELPKDKLIITYCA